MKLNAQMFQWRDEYKINNGIVDSQHRALLEILKLIAATIESRASLGEESFRRKMEDFMCDLLRYTEYHFSTEEDLMQKALYQNLEEHTKVHREIVQSIIEVRDRFATASTDELVEMLETLTQGWLTDHILKYDLLLKDLL